MYFLRPTGGSNFFGAGRYKPDQLTEAVSVAVFILKVFCFLFLFCCFFQVNNFAVYIIASYKRFGLRFH